MSAPGGWCQPSKDRLGRMLGQVADVERFTRVRLAEADTDADRQRAELALRHAVGLRKQLESWPTL